jgi:hypothetical protein
MLARVPNLGLRVLEHLALVSEPVTVLLASRSSVEVQSDSIGVRSEYRGFEVWLRRGGSQRRRFEE